MDYVLLRSSLIILSRTGNAQDFISYMNKFSSCEKYLCTILLSFYHDDFSGASLASY